MSVRREAVKSGSHEGDDFVHMPGGRWQMWRTIVLRSAGFPLRLVDRLSDEALAGAADRLLATMRSDPSSVRGRRLRPDGDALARYDEAFDAAVGRLGDVVGDVARDPRFREAIAWQNRRFIDTCLDAGGDAKRRDSRVRRREAAIASYVQRYATKNESIGYFGPVAWADWCPAGPAAQVTPGADLVRRRTVYLETWAIDAVGVALAERPELVHGVPPRRVPCNDLRDDWVHLPVGPPVQLSAQDATILGLCDGVRTVREVAAAYATNATADGERLVLERLRSMQRRGLVCLDFGGPVDAFPERALRQRLLRVADVRARTAALVDLDELLEGKDKLAAAAGDAGAVAAAIDKLNQDFERVTGAESTRLPGQTYAGRTIAYEDTTRDIEVRLGPEPLAQLAGPLSLVLDSARWLASRVGRDCVGRFEEYFERRRARSTSGAVPLASLLALATRDFYAEMGTAPLAVAAVAELQRRWSAILAVPRGVRRYESTVPVLAPAVAAAFASEQPRWAAGLVHSPDVMIAASSVDAINRGDYRFVLGELHTAFNSVESRALVEQSPDPSSLLAMAEAVACGRRVMVLAPRAWGAVTSRTSPPSALLSPKFVYWAVGADDVSNLPSAPIPVAALSVTRGDDGLIVQVRGDDRVFALTDVLGDYLSGVVANAFRMLPPAAHTPRVTIDRLVVSRETWRLPARRFAWAFQLDERRRYLQMRQWLDRHGLPHRAFYSVPIEKKPTFVDFTSIPLVNVLASVVRRVASAGPDSDIVLSEMLPDPAHAWLPDAAGEVYTSELRLVAAESRH